MSRFNGRQHVAEIEEAAAAAGTTISEIIPGMAPGKALGQRPIDLVGNTPLLRLPNIEADLPHKVELYAKAEWFNPGGSVKDRPALGMVEEAEQSGQLSQGTAILDATSGNTGIGLALMGALKGYRVTLSVPRNISIQKQRALRAYGAELVLTDPLEGTDGAQRVAKELHARHPDHYWYSDQYNNPANWQSHYRTTGPEIYRQTGGKVTHFIAGLGTSGTFVGVGRFLKAVNPFVKLISVQPDSPLHGLEGLKHMPSALVPGIYDPSLSDGQLEVATENAQMMVRKIAHEEGLLVGPSSGAALVAALETANCLDRGVVITVFPDAGDRYLHEKFWEEEP